MHSFSPIWKKLTSICLFCYCEQFCFFHSYRTRLFFVTYAVHTVLLPLRAATKSGTYSKQMYVLTATSSTYNIYTRKYEHMQKCAKASCTCESMHATLKYARRSTQHGRPSQSRCFLCWLYLVLRVPESNVQLTKCWNV